MSSRFQPIKVNNKPGPLIINGKRWYFRLVQNKTKRGRALMDDYSLNQIATHLVVCFTPGYLPGSKKRFLNKDGDNGRIYAFFDSYTEFFQYMKEVGDYSFYEIIFGELPQKPHFDIDINLKDFRETYKDEDFDTTAEIIKDLVI